jgi:arylsulfatase A-like enzyme
MKKQIFLAMIVLLAALSSCGKKEPGPPNIVLIVADDLGWKDLGFMGSSYYETPNLDRLAGEGMIFRKAYAAAANCAPSRACLMTGMYTTAHGIYTVGSSERGDTRNRRLIPATNTDTLHNRFFTLAEALKEAGYTTVNIGKWHLGKNPCTQGMDYNVGGGIWGHPGSYFAPYIRPNLEAPEGEYLTDRLTEEALEFMQQNRGLPFFLYLPYYAVHTPLQAKPRLEQKYTKKGPATCQANANYAGMVDNLDSCIGTLMKELEALGLSENTLIIFTSDNGGIREVSCQDPLRAGKGSYYEGGIRVPLIFRWPGKIEKGSVSEEPVINLDFYPTLMQIIGKESPENLDGLSLWPLLRGEETLPGRSLFFHFPVYLQAYKKGSDGGRDPLFRTRPGSMIIEGGWKLHYYYEDGGIELYQLSNDPGETTNLAYINTIKTEELLFKLEAWLEEEQAPVNFDANLQFDSLFEQQSIAEIY